MHLSAMRKDTKKMYEKGFSDSLCKKNDGSGPKTKSLMSMKSRAKDNLSF